MCLLYRCSKSSTGREILFIFVETIFYNLHSSISFYCRILNEDDRMSIASLLLEH